MTTIEGKVARVTGANTDIGKATSLGLATVNATVVLASRAQAHEQAAL